MTTPRGRPPLTGTPLVNLTVRLPVAVLAALRARAVAEGVTVGELIRRALGPPQS